MTDAQNPVALIETPDELLQLSQGKLKQLENAILQADSNSAELAILHAAHENLEKDYAAYIEARIALAHELQRGRDILPESE